MKKFNSIMSLLRLIFAMLISIYGIFLFPTLGIDDIIVCLTLPAVYYERQLYKLFLKNKGKNSYLIGLIIVVTIILLYEANNLFQLYYYHSCDFDLIKRAYTYGNFGKFIACITVYITSLITVLSLYSLLDEVISSSIAKIEYDTSSAIDPIDILIKAKQLNDLKVLNDLEFEKIKHILNNSNSPTDANKCSLLVDRLMKLAECKKLSVLSDDEIMSRKCKYLSEAGINLYGNFYSF